MERSRHFTEEEMCLARETDLPELLSHLGYQVRRIGRYHTTAEMDSLRIKGPEDLVSVLGEYRRGRHRLPAALLREILPGGGGVPAGLPWAGEGAPDRAKHSGG